MDKGKVLPNGIEVDSVLVVIMATLVLAVLAVLVEP